MNAIDVKNLSFRYRRDSDDVLTNIGFSVEKGEIFYFLGPNGTGKSTLLKCISGLLKPVSGEVFLEGKNLNSFAHAGLAKKLAFVPQSHSAAFPYPVRDIVVMGRSPHISILSSPSKKDYSIVDEVLENIGISALAYRPCTELSGGEWQLVLIARALAQDPGILLLDEPTSHLDLGNQIKILNAVKNMSESGLTILVATHFPDHALLNSDRTCIIKDRKIMAIGSTDEIITERNLQKAYGIDARIKYISDGIDRKICIPVLPAG